MSVNKVIVVGNLGADPVVRALPGAGGNVANFSLASTERFTDRSGNKQERTEWFRVVAFGKLADTCQRFLNKGRQVYVEGRLSTREYEAKDGSGKRYRTEVIARQIRFLGSRNNSARQRSGRQARTPSRSSNRKKGGRGPPYSTSLRMGLRRRTADHPRVSSQRR